MDLVVRRRSSGRRWREKPHKEVDESSRGSEQRGNESGDIGDEALVSAGFEAIHDVRASVAKNVLWGPMLFTPLSCGGLNSAHQVEPCQVRVVIRDPERLLIGASGAHEADSLGPRDSWVPLECGDGVVQEDLISNVREKWPSMGMWRLKVRWITVELYRPSPFISIDVEQSSLTATTQSDPKGQ